MFGLAIGADALGDLLGALQAGGELAVGLFDMAFEVGQFPAFQGNAGRQVHAHRIDLTPAAQNLIMEVRPGGAPRRPVIADNITLLNPTTPAHVLPELAEMRVSRLDLLVVLHAD